MPARSRNNDSWLEDDDDLVDAHFNGQSATSTANSQVVCSGALFTEDERPSDVNDIGLTCTDSVGTLDGIESTMPIPGSSVVEELNFGTPSLGSAATPQTAPSVPPMDDGAIDAYVEPRISRPPVISLSKKGLSTTPQKVIPKQGMRTLSSVSPVVAKIKPSPKPVKRAPKPVEKPAASAVTTKAPEKADSEPTSKQKAIEKDDIKVKQPPLPAQDIPKKASPQKPQKATSPKKSSPKKPQKAASPKKSSPVKPATQPPPQKQKKDSEKSKPKESETVAKEKKKWSMTDEENSQKKITDYTDNSQIKRRKESKTEFPTEIRSGMATATIRVSQTIRWIFDSPLSSYLNQSHYFSLLQLTSHTSVISKVVEITNTQKVKYPPEAMEFINLCKTFTGSTSN